MISINDLNKRYKSTIAGNNLLVVLSGGVFCPKRSLTPAATAGQRGQGG